MRDKKYSQLDKPLLFSRPYVGDTDLQLHIPSEMKMYNTRSFSSNPPLIDSHVYSENLEALFAMEEAMHTYASMMAIRKQLDRAYRELVEAK